MIIWQMLCSFSSVHFSRRALLVELSFRSSNAVLVFIDPGVVLLHQYDNMGEECDHVLVGDEVEHIYKGKSYCEDCYKMIRSTKIS
jgi:hypothetical protein